MGSAIERRVRVAGALAAVCVIWGSTYYAMRVGLETMPPLLMASSRFLLAGTVMFVGLRARGAPMPTARQWGASALTGSLMLVVGNGAVAFAQQRVSSSVAAIVVATMPLWMALFSRMWGERSSRGELVGLAVGFAGVAMLHAGGDFFSHGGYALAMLLAPAGWALGSVWSRRLSLPGGFMATAAQMLTAGAVLAVIGLVRGERLVAIPSARSIVAVLYMVLFGSVVAFSAYNYLLRTVRPSTASIYAYVNPLVAIVIGVFFAGETIHAPTILGALVILGGVLALSLAKRARASVPSSATAPAPTPTASEGSPEATT
jgi:drug/metabolite transporter (DMT)-like permease